VTSIVCPRWDILGHDIWMSRVGTQDRPMGYPFVRKGHYSPSWQLKVASRVIYDKYCFTYSTFNTAILFLFCLAPSFTSPVKVGFLLACEEDSNVVLSCVLLLNIASLVISPSDSSLFFLLYFVPPSSGFSHVLQIFYSTSSFLQRFGFFITARLVLTITTIHSAFFYSQKN
jgi:hypothetical protein